MKKTLMSLLTFSLIGWVAWAAQTQKIVGDVQDLATDRQLFQFVSEITTDGDVTTRVSRYIHPESGEVAVQETTQHKGSQLISYEILHNQLKEEGRVRVEGAKIHFERKGKDGKTKKKTEDGKANLAVGPTIGVYLADHWDEILTGKKVQISFAVWDRLETVGFRLWKTKDVKIEGRDAIEVTMNPTSWLIRQLVNDLVFTFDKNTKEMLAFRGRIPPKTKDGKDLDARNIYRTVTE